jgi:uncharacterized protein (TIRG00374 family)
MKNKIISWLITLIVISISLYFASKNGLELSLITKIGIHHLAILILLNLLSLISNSIINMILLNAIGSNISFIESFLLNTVGSWFNTILPFQGGALGRAFYLKNKYNTPYSKFISMQFGTYVLSFLLGGFLGIILWIWLFIQRIYMPSLILFFFLAILFSMLFLCFIPTLNRATRKNRLSNIIVNIINGWHDLKNECCFIKLFFFIFFNYLVSAFLLYVAFLAFGESHNFISMAFISLLISLTQIITITPGNLGIRETITGIMSQLVNSSFGFGVIISGLLRLISFSILLIIGPVCTSIIGISFYKKK